MKDQLNVPVSTPEQPFPYPITRPFIEPDWRRIPGYKNVSREEWERARWQRRNTIKTLDKLKEALGPLLPEGLGESIRRDQQERATMSILVPPHMLNHMDVTNLWECPVRRYMLPAYDDRHQEWPNHPRASRDSLHEQDMWVVEGLTHRYPTKVLAELLPTCPQYCGHCTRMDLVGNDVPQATKLRFEMKRDTRYEAMLDYLRETNSIRDVVVSGGDIANLPMAVLEPFLNKLLEIPHIQDVRLASKAVMALPQHFLQPEVLRGLERISLKARQEGVSLAMHTHVNHVSQVTPLMARVTESLLHMGFRDVRNQGVMLRGTNDDPKQLLDLCFRLLDDAKVMPYYFYMCDMIPNAEHWRISVAEAQQIQHDIMGYLPGFATPRLLCDVPYVGKRWVHQNESYDRVRGISYWTKNYRTGIELDDPKALDRRYEFFDPIYTLPEEGQAWWREALAKGGE
ncbi:MAG: lysine 2,3-aminomutase [Deltaproteobacteria bacterium]|nr:lysine 2,3-aminomutase [Deltaproteobacteria bacterium]